MKKIILLLALSFSLTGCMAQLAPQPPLQRKVATVTDISSTTATLSAGRFDNYKVASEGLELFKEYVLWLEIIDCATCPTKQAVIAGKAFTSAQVQKDQEAEAARLSNRIIIK